MSLWTDYVTWGFPNTPSLPKGFPRGSPRLPKGSQSLLLSSCFFLILASIPFVNNTNCTADIRIGLPIVWPILRSLCWVLGCSESVFPSKNSPNCVRYLPGGIAKNAVYFVFFCDFSPHFCPENIVSVAKLSLYTPIFVCFLPIAFEVWGVRNHIFRNKKQPKPAQTVWGTSLVKSQKTRFFVLFLFARASDFSPHVLPKNIVWVAKLSMCTPIRIFFSSDVASRVWPILAASQLIFANVSHFLMMRHWIF